MNTRSLKKKSTKIPKRVLNEMQVLGALVKKLKGEDLYLVTEIVYGDEAWKVYEHWGNTIESNIIVGAMFAPPENIINSVLCPNVSLGFPIQKEANSIILHYASLRIEDFQNEKLPKIPAPIAAPKLHTNISHPTIALSKMMHRIQNPPKNYPILDSLHSGSYICTVNQQWSNAGVVIHLFKP
jgi:hypothetical protein